MKRLFGLFLVTLLVFTFSCGFASESTPATLIENTFTFENNGFSIYGVSPLKGNEDTYVVFAVPDSELADLLTNVFKGEGVEDYKEYVSSLMELASITVELVKTTSEVCDYNAVDITFALIIPSNSAEDDPTYLLIFTQKRDGINEILLDATGVLTDDNE